MYIIKMKAIFSYKYSSLKTTKQSQALINSFIKSFFFCSLALFVMNKITIFIYF